MMGGDSEVDQLKEAEAKVQPHGVNNGIRWGRVELTAEVAQAARELAKEDFAACEAEWFCGDEVRDLNWPDWMPDLEDLLPNGALEMRGRRAVLDGAHLYATCGVDPHTDDMDGESIAIVLHADGHTFRDAEGSVPLAPGTYFIFDDRVEHEVVETDEATTMLLITIPLAKRVDDVQVEGLMKMRMKDGGKA